MSWLRLALLNASVAAVSVPLGAQQRPPVFDVHLHALSATSQGPPPMWICAPMSEFPTSLTGASYPAELREPPCSNPIWSAESDEDLMAGTIRVMEEWNVYGVLSGTASRVARWSQAAPERFLRGLGFNLGSGISPDSLRALHAAGALEVLAEVTNQYGGIAPDHPGMDPYWDLAEELDIPVGIHIGPGPPGVIYLGSTNYRARLHNALLLEDVLVDHPDLRVYVMHAGFPLIDETLALLYAHPQVHVGIGIISYGMPREAFYPFLEKLVDAGFTKRIMFGSDQMVWPETIERAIRTVLEAPFLSESQKRDILYNNAARFFRLSDEERARHRRAGSE